MTGGEPAPARPAPPVAELDDVFCLYRLPGSRSGVVALRGVDLTLAAGQRVLLRGANGSGKTTLLRLLAGRQEPVAGRLRLAGVGLGWVDQHSGAALLPELDVLGNVALPLRLDGTPRRRALQRARALLAEHGLAELAARPVAALSGGQAQRVAVCAALVRGPGLILADEPTAQLDPVSAEQVHRALVAASGPGLAALLLVSHGPVAVAGLDRQLWLHRGSLLDRAPEPAAEAASGRAAGTASGAAEPAVPALPATGGGVRLRVRRPGGEELGVAPGQWLAVRGRAGAGKTTLLRALAGIDRPPPGAVSLDGVDLALPDRAALAALRRSRVAVVGQEVPLDAAVDPGATLDLALAARGLAADGDGADRARRLLDLLGLAGLSGRPAGTLSGGQRQRLAVARALVAGAGLLLLDEPTAHLDPEGVAAVRAALLAARDGGSTVVIATHEPALLAPADLTVDLDDAVAGPPAPGDAGAGG